MTTWSATWVWRLGKYPIWMELSEIEGGMVMGYYGA